MRNKRAILAAFVPLCIISAIAYAAASGDRLKSPVKVGQGTAVVNQVIFDNGNGATAPMIAGDTGSNVGINTTAPAGVLGVAAYSGADVNTFVTRAGTTTGTQRWKMYPSSGTTPRFEIDIDHSGSPRMLFQSDTNSIMELDQNGDIGINVFPPSQKLDVGGNLRVGSDAFILGQVGIGTTSPGYDLEVDDTTAGADVITFATRAGTPTGNQRWYFLPSSGTTPRFEIDASNTQMVIQSDSANLFTMTHSGNVGLSMSPARRLDVAGDMGATGSLTLGGTGGNTPHGCTIRSDTSVVTVNHTITCNAGEIVTGGGCRTNSVSFLVADTFPSATNQWECNYNTTGAVTNTAYAVCCSI